MVDELDAGPVCNLAEHGRANPSHAKSKAKKQARNDTDLTGISSWA